MKVEKGCNKTVLVKRIFSILNLPSINFIFISLLIFVAFLIEKFLRKV